ncbi:OmpP1/FadL family transporter [Vibrio sp. RE86]|uniref:OmpP1/FadL family transporter n=1 Tax=Vibrio sp. RE86 TaxID=2607605 RepID=UPI00149362C5|nr:outer membrane protein transport protein [Vibrio sp. RE86]
MYKNFTFAQSALLVGAALLSTQAKSAGFQIVEHSASGLGRAFAGEAAIADNASTLARNPASLSMLESANFTSGISFIDPDVQVQFLEIAGNGGLQNSAYEDEAAPTALVPNAFYSRPINDKWTWGMGAYADFGLASDYSDTVNEEFGEIAGDTAVSVINLNNSLAYEVNDSLTLGVSASILLAHAELNRYSNLASVAPNYDGNLVSSMKGDGIGFGYKVGALYELNENHRFGIAYTGASDIDMEGKFSGLQLNSPEGDGTFHYFTDIDGELTLNLPSILELSGYHQLNEKFAVHYSWVMIGWSSFQEIFAQSVGQECSNGTDGDRECLRKEEGWKDSNRFSVGATGKVNEDWTVRLGWALDQTPTDQHVTASIPDSERTWMTAGTTYQMDAHTFDFGIAYIKGEDGEIHQEDGMYFSVEKSTAMIYSAQYSYNF